MPGYLLHDVLTPFGGQLWFSRPTMGGAESLLRGSLFRACRLAVVPRLHEAKAKQTTIVARDCSC